jgi:hypothetical protein
MRTRGLMLMLLAIAVGVLLPLRASATILPFCELQPTSSTMTAPPEPTCELAAADDDDLGDTSSAPMCDLRGASVVAPPQIFPVDDARIEAGPRGCSATVSSPSLSPLPQESPVQVNAASTDVMTLAVLVPLPPPADWITIDFIADDSRPHAGVMRTIFHPPRLLKGRKPLVRSSRSSEDAAKRKLVRDATGRKKKAPSAAARRGLKVRKTR